MAENNRSKQFPYTNMDLDDMRGEEWEDIPGLEGLYVVSNYGRIRRQAFEILCSNGQIRKMKEKILVPDITLQENNSVKDKTYFLRTKLMVEGKSYIFSIQRLVYHCFVREFDLENSELVVQTKDGNGFNIQPGNLQLVDISTKQKRIFERGRFKNTTISSYDEYKSRGLLISANANCRQVSQYTMNGKRLYTFPSIAAAAKALKFRAPLINSVLKNRQVSTGGYVWRYGKAPTVDMRSLREDKSIHHKKLVGKKISQYNTKGKRISVYLTISDAAKASGASHGDILATLSGKQKTAAGFIWKRGWGALQIDTSNFVYGQELRAQKKQKKVKQYGLDGKLIQTFPSVKAAAQSVGVTPSNISAALDKNSKRAGGYFWKSFTL